MIGAFFQVSQLDATVLNDVDAQHALELGPHSFKF
ncbi:hypothetical protein NTG1052_210009 [Candidatus Nitrotoga sp. 1052]|nr:hypothetical protein NTG1052_210009 [Candidatus Nitrotoga sp. 1052]